MPGHGSFVAKIRLMRRLMISATLNHRFLELWKWASSRTPDPLLNSHSKGLKLFKLRSVVVLIPSIDSSNHLWMWIPFHQAKRKSPDRTLARSTPLFFVLVPSHIQNFSKRIYKTYNSAYSQVVTYLTTSPPIYSLNMGERTGSLVFYSLCSYVKGICRRCFIY